MRLRLTQTGAKRDIIVRDAHSAPATTGGRFNDDGITDVVGDAQRALLVVRRRHNVVRAIAMGPTDGRGLFAGLVDHFLQVA